jgi:hypothetical protein
VWTIREASLFDIFARKILKPLICNVPGVFVHLYITGTPAFPVQTPLEILYNLEAKEMLKRQTPTLPKIVDPRRSALNPDDAGTESLSAKKARAMTKSNGSTHNFLQSILENEKPSANPRIIETKAGDGIITAVVSNFAISFGRPNYGNISLYYLCFDFKHYLQKLNSRLRTLSQLIYVFYQCVTKMSFSAIRYSNPLRRK